MITSFDGRPVAGIPPGGSGAVPPTSAAPPVSAGPVIVAVTDGDRTIGAWIVDSVGVTYRPVVDLTRLAATVLAATGAVAVAISVAAACTANRRRPSIGSVTMGPGGWVSVKRTPAPRLRSAAPAPRRSALVVPRRSAAASPRVSATAEHRPWWAHLLGAHRLSG